ncbi:MAG: response regulator, partial [Proteobacteria bacterium]
MTGKIKVMIVEDSVVVREMLIHIINSDSRLEVISAVGSGEAAIKALQVCSPQVISLDIRLPGMDGFETTRQIMMERPTPIVVISDNVDGDQLNISMNALRAGALAVLEKPVGFSNSAFAPFAAKICDSLSSMSTVKV